MAEIIRLRAAKKQMNRAKKRVQADEKTLKFGRTKAEKTLEAARAEKAARDLDGHRTTRTDDT